MTTYVLMACASSSVGLWAGGSLDIDIACLPDVAIFDVVVFVTWRVSMTRFGDGWAAVSPEVARGGVDRAWGI